MLRNAAGHLKAGGRFVGVREANLDGVDLARVSKYGAAIELAPIPGGFRYQARLLCDPPVEFEAASLEILYSGSPEVYEKAGLSDVEVVPYESAEVVQKDPEFRKDFLAKPCLAVVRAVKKGES